MVRVNETNIPVKLDFKPWVIAKLEVFIHIGGQEKQSYWAFWFFSSRPNYYTGE